MSAWLPERAAGAGSDRARVGLVDPTRDLAALRRRWEVRGAQWRAVAMAESIFGGPVATRLQPGGAGGLDDRGRPRFRGLLHLEVPFADVELHRWRERVFAACAGEDPVLSRVPFVFVFAPAGPPGRVSEAARGRHPPVRGGS